MTQLRNVNVHDSLGNSVGSLNNALDVHVKDVHYTLINAQISQDTATTTTFSIAATAGDTSINLTSATGFAIGNYLHVFNATGEEPVKLLITNLVGTVATIDRPLDNSYAIGDTITRTIINMAVAGTLAAPEAFNVKPGAGNIWHITRILIEMTHATAGDNGLFGDLGPLSNGVVLRRYDGATGTYGTYTIWRSNNDIVTDMYDVVFAARSGGGGSFGTNCRGTFASTGAVVRLDGTAGDFLEVLVQDSLIGLDSFRIKAQGHFEG